MSTDSILIFSFAFLYCLANSKLESSSSYPIKKIFISLSIFLTLSLLSCVKELILSWLKSIGVNSFFCIKMLIEINMPIIIAISKIVFVPSISHLLLNACINLLDFFCLILFKLFSVLFSFNLNLLLFYHFSSLHYYYCD